MGHWYVFSKKKENIQDKSLIIFLIRRSTHISMWPQSRGVDGHSCIIASKNLHFFTMTTKLLFHFECQMNFFSIDTANLNLFTWWSSMKHFEWKPFQAFFNQFTNPFFYWIYSTIFCSLSLSAKMKFIHREGQIEKKKKIVQSKKRGKWKAEKQ